MTTPIERDVRSYSYISIVEWCVGHSYKREEPIREQWVCVHSLSMQSRKVIADEPRRTHVIVPNAIGLAAWKPH